MTDLEIIEKCKNWDLALFWKLYEKYIDKIYRFVYLKVSDNEVAEDIVSDVFMSALNKVSSFKIDGNSSVQAWFYTIAHNKVVDYYRTNKLVEDLDACFDLWIEVDLNQDIDNKDKLKEILEFVKWLKKEHREVFLYRIWEDLSYKEIAEITSLSEANCKQIVSRTLKNIWTNFAMIIILLLTF